MKKYILIILILISSILINAQNNTESDNTDDEKTNNIDFSMEYMNKAAFSGRNNMVNGGMYSPSVTLNLKSGFSVGITTYLMPEDTSKTKQIELAIGYEHDFFDWWNLQAGCSIYRTTVTTKKKTQVQNDIGVSLANTFDFEWMFLQNSIYYYYGSVKGWDVTFLLGKDIALDDMLGIEDLSISPTFTYELGNHFAKFRQLKKDLLTTVKTPNKFQALDYELSLPINYEYKSFSFDITPSYAFPVNLLPLESNLGSNFFYLSAKITYTLGL